MKSVLKKDINKEKSHSVRCENCGAEMLFNINNGSLKCDYCGNVNEIKLDNIDTSIKEENFLQAQKELQTNKINKNSVQNEFQCKSCGVIIISDNEKLSHKCIYCGSSYVVNNENATYIQPGYIIPFSVDEKKVKEEIQSYYENKLYISKEFKKKVNNFDINPSYISFWTFDTMATIQYSGERGDYYYITVTKTINGEQKQVQERRTRWSYVSDRYQRFFDDVLIQGEKSEDKYLNKIKDGYNLNALVPYNAKYVLGFTLKKYDVGLEECWVDAKRSINSTIEYEVEKKMGGDTNRNVRWTAGYDNITFKHIILPIWICTVEHKNKTYRLIVNGQSGCVEGSYHKSWIKIAVTILIVIFILAKIFII